MSKIGGGGKKTRFPSLKYHTNILFLLIDAIHIDKSKLLKLSACTTTVSEIYIGKLFRKSVRYIKVNRRDINWETYACKRERERERDTEENGKRAFEWLEIIKRKKHFRSRAEIVTKLTSRVMEFA